MKEAQDPWGGDRRKLAKDFATAFVANKMRVTFRTARNYVRGESESYGCF